MTTQTDNPAFAASDVSPELVELVAKRCHEKQCRQLSAAEIHAPVDCPNVEDKSTVDPHEIYCDSCRIGLNRWELLRWDQQYELKLRVRLVLEASEETV